MKNVHQYAVEGYPANVKYFNAKEYNVEYESEKARQLSEIDSELRLDEANLEVREHDAANIRTIIEHRNELYARRNALLSKEDRINVNEAIAEDMGITERQVMKYKAISNLIPELKEIFDKNGMSVNDGASYASLSEEDQRQLLELIEEGQEKKKVNELYKQLKDMQVQIGNKESEIQKLMDEKQEAISQAKKAQEDIINIEKTMQKKIAEESSNSPEVQRLQSELQQKNAELQRSKANLQVAEDKHKKKIEELETQLRQKEELKKNPERKEYIKASLQLQSQVEMLQKTMEQLRTAYAEYTQCYMQSAEEGNISPEEYLEQIKEMLLW